LSFTSAFEDAVVGGKKFSEVLDGLAQDIIRMTVRKAVTEPLTQAFSAGFSSFLGSYGFGSGAGAAAGSSFIGTGAVAGAAFADGGIMTANGALPLRRYSAGGIARSPQVALFGEGSTPEAYVPVPSGKIPVEMRGTGVTVQIIDQRKGGADIEVSQQQGGDGKMIIQAIIKEVANDIARRGGVGQAIEQTYGVNRQVARR